jgi:hypothetical protein
MHAIYIPPSRSPFNRRRRALVRAIIVIILESVVSAIVHG